MSISSDPEIRKTEQARVNVWGKGNKPARRVMSHEALTYSFFFLGKTWNSRGIRFVREMGSWIWSCHLQGKPAILK